MDGDAIVVSDQALIGSLELLPEAMRLGEPCALLVVITPGPQASRIAAGRGAGRCRAVACQSSTRSRRWRRSAGRRTLTIRAWSWACLGMDAPSCLQHTTGCSTLADSRGKNRRCQAGIFPRSLQSAYVPTGGKDAMAGVVTRAAHRLRGQQCCL